MPGIIDPKRSPFVDNCSFVVAIICKAAKRRPLFICRQVLIFKCFTDMQNTIKTAGKTAEWKPEYEGATMVFIIDCHWNHNIENAIEIEVLMMQLLRDLRKEACNEPD